MKIFLTGATGVIGTRALPGLVGAGHDVTAVARTDDKANLVERLGGNPVRCDLFDPSAVHDTVSGHDAVVHLATHIPPMMKAASTTSWAINDRLRTDASRNLVDAATAAGAGRFVQESVCFPYEDQGADGVDEDDPRTSGSVFASTSEAEANAGAFADDAAPLSFSASPSSTQRTATTSPPTTRWPASGSRRFPARRARSRRSSTQRTRPAPWSRRSTPRQASTTSETTSRSREPRPTP